MTDECIIHKGMTIPEYVISLLNGLPIEEVANKLGLEVKKHKTLCFKHNDHNPSITFSKPKNIYRCWVCGVGGGPIQLVQDKEGWDFPKACIWLGKEFNIWWPKENEDIKFFKRTARKVYLPKSTKVAFVFDEEIYTWLINNAPLLEPAKEFLFINRNLKEDVVQKLRIGSIINPSIIIDSLVKIFGEERCLKTGLIRRGDYGLYLYFYTPCLLFPYYDQNGRLIGVQSRFLGINEKAPRFQFLSSQKTRLYNLSILNNLKRGDKLYISEGITDCLALLSDNLNAVAIPSATLLPMEDLILLKNYDLYMYPDQDEAGQKAFMALRRFFVNHYSTVKIQKLPEGVKDYCDFYIKKQETYGEG